MASRFVARSWLGGVPDGRIVSCFTTSIVGSSQPTKASSTVVR